MKSPNFTPLILFPLDIELKAFALINTKENELEKK